MQKKYDDFSMQEAMRLAQSESGRALFALLQQNNGAELQKAMEQAAAGNYAQVSKTMASLLSSPEAKALLEQMGGKGHG